MTAAPVANLCPDCGHAITSTECLRCALDREVARESFDYLIFRDTLVLAQAWLDRADEKSLKDRVAFINRAIELSRTAAHQARTVAANYWTAGHDDTDRNAIAWDLYRRYTQAIACPAVRAWMRDELKRIAS